MTSAAPDAPGSPPPLTEDQLSGRLFIRWNAAAATLGFVALGVGLAFVPRSAPATVAPFDPVRFAADARWDDGKAELARYAAVRKLYGRDLEYEVRRIAVKEPYDPATRVKPDVADATTITAFKTVVEHTTPTARLYAYHQQVICRVARSDPRHLLDMTLSSHEWCGNTFQVVHRRGDTFARTVHSYWAGEGDRTDALPGEVWFEDQLPFTLRALPLEDGARIAIRLVPTILSSRAPATQPQPATIEVGSVEVIEVPAGSFSCAPVTIRREDGDVLRYWIATDGGRALVRYEDGTGRGELRSLERVAYWEDPK